MLPCLWIITAIDIVANNYSVNATSKCIRYKFNTNNNNFKYLFVHRT